jgi:hypothetical protein
MSPWPGAPKSASSPPLNVPSTRYPNTLNEHSTMADVADAMRTAFNGLTVHEQAFAALPDQIKAQAAAAATTAIENVQSENVTNVVTAFNSAQGAIIYFPGMGLVNNQMGQTAYTTRQADNGSLVLFADSSPIFVTLDAGVVPPWFCWISNTGASNLKMTPDSGMINNDSSLSLPSQSWATVFVDSTPNFWALGAAS